MEYVSLYSINYFLMYWIESIFAVVVDLFILISGYYMFGSNHRNLQKPIQLIVQVMVFSELLYLIKVCFGTMDFSLYYLIAYAVPANYFVILYCTLFIVSPYINIILNNLSWNSQRLFIIILFVLFSVYPTAVDVLE